MKVLITGGTGTLGVALASKIKADEVVIFSRNEHNQVKMKKKFPDFTYVIGDVRDYKSIKYASKGAHTIFHLASIKHVSVCEDQPMEALKTNVFGTANVIKAAQKNGCRLVNISTDKAENPSSFYGITKLMAERLIQKYGYMSMRSGNIFGSSGSVIPLFIDQIRKNNAITLTNGNMTRFWILAEDLADVLIKMSYGGTHLPKLKSYTMFQVADAVKELYGDKETEIKEIGAKYGEKMNEFLYGESSSDCLSTYEELIKMFKKWDLSLI